MPPGSEKRSSDSHVTYLYFIDHVVCDVLFVPVYTQTQHYLKTGLGYKRSHRYTCDSMLVCEYIDMYDRERMGDVLLPM